MNIQVVGNRIVLDQSAVTTNSLEFPELNLTLSAEWTGLSVVCLFRQGETVTARDVVGNVCSVPAVTAVERLYLGIVGELHNDRGEVVKRISTNIVSLPLNGGALVEVESSKPVPEDSVWSRYLATVEAHEQAALNSKVSANTAAEVATNSELAAANSAQAAEASALSAESDQAATAADRIASADSALAASNDASSASSSAQAALTSEQEAAQSAQTAATKATDASNSAAEALSSKNAAATSATNAAGSATASTSEANRAKTEADRAKTEADRVAATDVAATNLALSKTNDKLTDLSNTLSTANLNQSPTQTITGYDKILSLPKNAANAGASVGVKGMTAQNLVVNGDFSSGTTGWTAGNGALAVIDGVGQNTGDGLATNQVIVTNLTSATVIGNKYYYATLARATNGTPSSFRFSVGGVLSINGALTQNVWERKSGVVQATTATKQIYPYVNYADAATQSGKVFQIDNVSVVDLTAIFGAGNEPDLATCDKIFANWFDGLKSTKSRGRVKSVGKNLFDGIWESGSIDANTGVHVVGATSVRTKNFIRVNQNTAYTASRTTTANLKVRFYDKDKTYIGYATYTGTAGLTYSYTTPANTQYIRFTVDTTTDLAYQFQLELGTVATTYEPFRSSELYINATEPLRRVPNGTVDEQRKRADGWYERVGRNVEYTLVAGDVAAPYTGYASVDVFFFTLLSGADQSSNTGKVLISGKENIGAANRDSADNVGKYYVGSTNVGFVFAKGTNLAAAQTALAGTKIIYQLASPIITPIETSGTLLSYPSGSVYFEPITADAGIYNNGINIMATGFPISALETLSKVDFATGVETALDVSTAVIASNGLSFTHAGLTNGNIVFFTYRFKNDAPEGSKTASYYDSRYVVADTTNGKFYQWKIATTNGVPSITAVEV